MLFRSFAAYSHVFALILSSFLLLSLPDAASGAQQNITVRFDSSQVPVSFTTGWRVAEFTGTGKVNKFAFANNPGEEVVVQVPQNVTALFYQGFKIKGGARYLVCLDCDSGVDTTPHMITVDAHDPTEDGTQPPDTLFFTEVDPTQSHVLRVINLEDDRFNDTSQITFDSVVLTFIDGDPGSPSLSTGSPTSTTSAGATSTIPSGGNPTTTVPVAPTDASSSVSPVTSSLRLHTPSVSASQSVTTGVTTTSSSNSQGTTSVSSNGSGASQTQTSSNLSATSPGSQTSVVGSTTGSGGSQPTSTAVSGPGSGPSPSSSPGPDMTSSPGPSNGGVSRTVIIVVAVIASVFVLALLAAITWLLIRNQPPPRGDVEGTAGLMREAAPNAITVSGPLPLSPMRPEIPNPFVDPLDDFPPPRPAPSPPVPPRSPVRATNFPGDRPAWLTRTPRTSSPESSNE